MELPTRAHSCHGSPPRSAEVCHHIGREPTFILPCPQQPAPRWLTPAAYTRGASCPVGGDARNTAKVCRGPSRHLRSNHKAMIYSTNPEAPACRCRPRLIDAAARARPANHGGAKPVDSRHFSSGAWSKLGLFENASAFALLPQLRLQCPRHPSNPAISGSSALQSGEYEVQSNIIATSASSIQEHIGALLFFRLR